MKAPEQDPLELTEEDELLPVDRGFIRWRLSESGKTDIEKNNPALIYYQGFIDASVYQSDKEASNSARAGTFRALSAGMLLYGAILAFALLVRAYRGDGPNGSDLAIGVGSVVLLYLGVIYWQKAKRTQTKANEAFSDKWG